MKTKKILKLIGKIILTLITVLAALLIILIVSRQIRLKLDRDFLKEKGYYNLVSVGDHSLNMVSFGNEKGKHRIIAIAGYGVPDSCITMRAMTRQFEQDNQVIFLDRAGYGASDDTDHEMTVEYIVEDYRTALKNAGVGAPYVLMPHSIGGVYASYWASKYPQEVEGVAILDGTEIRQIDVEDEPPRDMSMQKKMLWFDKLGFGNVALRAFLPKNPAYTADEQKIEDALELMTFDSAAVISEGECQLKNISDTWDMIITNDIPKIYICAGCGFQTKEEIIANGGLSEERIEAATYLYDYESFEERTQAAYEVYLSDCEDVREKYVKPYAEKIGNCRVVLLPGDHLIYAQKPDECARIIQDFLDEIE